jgi:hypothetical protein
MFNPGDLVIWSHTPRGGYGYTFGIGAVVVRVNKKTVTIRVKRLDGRRVEIRVNPEKLSPQILIDNGDFEPDQLEGHYHSSVSPFELPTNPYEY